MTCRSKLTKMLAGAAKVKFPFRWGLMEMLIYLMCIFSAEKKVLNLVEQYEELKKNGKLSKHIEKLRKKNARRDKKKLDHDI